MFRYFFKKIIEGIGEALKQISFKICMFIASFIGIAILLFVATK